MIYVWSDTHFNHFGIIGHCARPWKTVREMNAGLIERWNSVVGPRDDIYLLGDFGFKAAASNEDADDIYGIFAKLHGKKHLVVGNHDEKNPVVLKQPWDSQRHLGVIRENGMSAVVCHYPLETWSGSHKGRIMLHGHSHGSLKRKLARRFDVGVDVYPDAPVPLEVLWEVGQAQRFEATDAHEEHGRDM